MTQRRSDAEVWTASFAVVVESCILRLQGLADMCLVLQVDVYLVLFRVAVNNLKSKYRQCWRCGCGVEGDVCN